MGGILKSTWEMLHDGRFLKKALMIACPVALQGMLNTIVNMVDTLMIGGLGSTAIAAVGLANKVFFVFSLLVFGIVSGGGMFYFLPAYSCLPKRSLSENALKCAKL